MAEVEQLTPDAVALTFAVPPELREEFAFAPGQHLTLLNVPSIDDAICSLCCTLNKTCKGMCHDEGAASGPPLLPMAHV